jgi:hypothetical protein
MQRYRNISQLDVDKFGPCLVTGHPKEHKMDMNPCWMTMRSYLLNHSFEEYLEAVRTKD